MSRIKVLWMNNGDAIPPDYYEILLRDNLSITICSNMEELKNKTESTKSWDAIFLHPCPKSMAFDQNSEKKRSKRNPYTLFGALLTLEKINKYTNFIVSTDCIDDEFLKKDMSDFCEVHPNLIADSFVLLKPDDCLDLCNKVKETVENAPEYRLRKKYEEIIMFIKEIDDASEKILLQLLRNLDGIDRRDLGTDNSIPNKVRKVLEIVCKFLTEINLLDGERFMGSNISRCSKYLADKKQKEVPVHVLRHFHSCSEISNDGSHALSENLHVDQQIKKGQAPYLNIALIYDLLNILHWCTTLK